MDEFQIDIGCYSQDGAVLQGESSSESSYSESPGVMRVTKRTKTEVKTKRRRYDESYIRFGFVSTNSDPALPLCVICNQTLSKNSMKPSLLRRHFVTKHKELQNKPIEFFKRKASEIIKSRSIINHFSQSNKIAQKTSYELAFLTARAKKDYSITENLIIPGALIIAENMLGGAAVNAIKSIPFSDTTMARRIEEMACDVSQQVIEKIKQDKRLALQLDESTDISNQAQLLMYVRYYDEGINDQILACKSLLGKTTGEKIFEVLDGHIRAECGFKWEWCTSISSDGAASMTGHTNGIIARLKLVNPNLKWQHCMIHKQALATKKMSPELHMVLDETVKIVD